MRPDHKNLSDSELRKLLNLGDPAGDGNEPSREELNTMRRTVLNTIDSNPEARPWLSRPYAAAAATVAVALIALALLLRAGPWGAVLQPETGPVTPAEPAPAAPIGSGTAVAESPEALSTDPAPATASNEVTPQGMEPQAAPQATAVAEVPMVEAEQSPVATVEESPGVVSPTGERQARTVRFTAPGGTRIIWTLDPDFQLPVSEPDDRARGEL